MLTLFVQGLALGLQPAASFGPFKMFLMSTTLRDGWKRTLPFCLSPLLADIPIVLLVLLVLGRVPQALLNGLSIAGGLFMLYLAWRIVRAMRKGNPGITPNAAPSTSGRTLLQTLSFIWLSPGPYITWTLVLGPILIQALGQSALHAVSFLAGFYAVFVAGLAVFVVAVGVAGALNANFNRWLMWLSVLALTVLGLSQIGDGLSKWLR